MKTKFILLNLFYSLLIGVLANSFLFIRRNPQILFALVPIFLLVCIFAGSSLVATRRSKTCCHGAVMLYAFCPSLILSVIYHSLLMLWLLPEGYKILLWSILQCAGVLFLVFWIGILCVYLASSQLSFRLRLVGILCGWIPVANLVALLFILRAVTAECLFEMDRDQRNRKRKDQALCATKYPLLLVHGVFFRDFKYFNYWGRIPKELETNGAAIYYGNQPSAASVADSAEVLKDRIEQILAETGAEKVNIIAHSKGGLDCRYAIAHLGIGSRVASLTTINTPHRGCLFADYLLTKIPTATQDTVASTYNKALSKLGEPEADFMAAVKDLTDTACRQRDLQMPTPDGIFCQSVGSIMTKASGGKFPLNFSYHLVNHFSGENDGLVSEDSFSWGENYTRLRTPGKQGISGFDVREFYVELVHDLKNRGL